LVFKFVVPVDYDLNGSDDFVCTIGDSPIEFHNFYNGTLIILGDSVNEKNAFPRKTAVQIEDPVRYDGVNMKQLIARIEDKIDRPDDIVEMAEYESNAINKKVKYKKIIISGTAMNENFSVVSIYDINAKVYVMNLKVVNSMKPITENSDDIPINYIGTTLPSNDKLLLFYPFEKDTKCYECTQFVNFIDELENSKSVAEAHDIYVDEVIGSETNKRPCRDLVDSIWNGRSQR